MKRLYRSENDRLIVGVCGGLGEYLSVDPVVIRIAWVLLTLILIGTGMGIVLYLAGWLLIPKQ